MILKQIPISIHKYSDDSVLASFKCVVPVVTTDEYNALNSWFQTNKNSYPTEHSMKLLYTAGAQATQFLMDYNNHSFRNYCMLPFFCSKREGVYTQSMDILRTLSPQYKIDLSSIFDGQTFEDYGNSNYLRLRIYFKSGTYSTKTTAFYAYKSKSQNYYELQSWGICQTRSGSSNLSPNMYTGLLEDFADFVLFADASGTITGIRFYRVMGYYNYVPHVGLRVSDTSTQIYYQTSFALTDSPLFACFMYSDDTKEYDPDPYAGNLEPSESGGGTGTFSETGDTIGIPGLPTLSAVDTGFITLFNPSAAQVKALANYMWSSSFDLATFKNIVANPIDCILGLTIVPVDPPNAGSKVVSVGNIPTDVTLPYLSSQYVEVDCGTLNVQEFWGSYLDYSPYTKMSLYLPYIGIIPLDIDDVMNASITVKYHVDVLSGACVAYVLCNGTQLYTYVGQCSSNVPITSNDFTNTVNGILGIAGSIGKLAADGGASAPTEAAGIAANAINALKPNIQKSGAMSGTGGLMGVQTPYLICQRPRQSVPAKQNSYTGYPSNITAKLSTLSGYTEVDSIHLDGLSATQEEQQEIMDLLTSGVII